MTIYKHVWTCANCGKTVKRTTSQPGYNLGQPSIPGKCVATPGGRHVVIKTQ